MRREAAAFGIRVNGARVQARFQRKKWRGDAEVRRRRSHRLGRCSLGQIPGRCLIRIVSNRTCDPQACLWTTRRSSRRFAATVRHRGKGILDTGHRCGVEEHRTRFGLVGQIRTVASPRSCPTNRIHSNVKHKSDSSIYILWVRGALGANRWMGRRGILDVRRPPRHKEGRGPSPFPVRI